MTNGGLAQLARASGSYPAGRWFKSDIRYHKRPVGQAVKTRPFHGCNMGSIPVRVTNHKKAPQQWCFSFFVVGDPYVIEPSANMLCVICAGIRITASPSRVETLWARLIPVLVCRSGFL